MDMARSGQSIHANTSLSSSALRRLFASASGKIEHVVLSYLQQMRYTRASVSASKCSLSMTLSTSASDTSQVTFFQEIQCVSMYCKDSLQVPLSTSAPAGSLFCDIENCPAIPLPERSTQELMFEYVEVHLQALFRNGRDSITRFRFRS